MKKLLFVIPLLFLTACTSNTEAETVSPVKEVAISINKDSVEETITYLQDTFETDGNVVEETEKEYGNYRKVYKVNDEIFIYPDDEDVGIDEIYFRGIPVEEAELILEEINFPESADFERILADPEGYYNSYDRRHYFITYHGMGVHLVQAEEEVARAMGFRGTVSLFLVYNQDLFEEFEAYQ
ncbi:hypothetical protein [Trichococcus alkaliphilus]|uniref:hypothetical protein n=1 Tax=Trichococcus alkaliphilus TaxID=2052943 RepID=UPI000D0B6C93|nr:hypothetical protein [Trichococcus alkaliphilus]